MPLQSGGDSGGAINADMCVCVFCRHVWAILACNRHRIFQAFDNSTGGDARQCKQASNAARTCNNNKAYKMGKLKTPPQKLTNRLEFFFAFFFILVFFFFCFAMCIYVYVCMYKKKNNNETKKYKNVMWKCKTGLKPSTKMLQNNYIHQHK